MGACSSYLYKQLQGLPVQECVVLQELELLQLELVLKVGLCLLFQQLEHHRTQEQVKDTLVPAAESSLSAGCVW